MKFAPRPRRKDPESFGLSCDRSEVRFGFSCDIWFEGRGIELIVTLMGEVMTGSGYLSLEKLV